MATLIHLRHDLPHAVLALMYGVDRSTVTRAVGEVRGLLAGRGFAVPDRPGVRLRTLEDVFAYAQAEGVRLRLDATEVQVRRPAADRGGRRAFVSGKKKQNTMKATVIADHQGRTLWTDALRPGRMHDVTAARTAGIGRCFDHFDLVQVLLDDGYLGLSKDHRGRALTSPASYDQARPCPSSNTTNASGSSTPRSGSPSNRPSPTTNAGNNSSAEPTAATASPTPTERSPASCPTAPPPPEESRSAAQTRPTRYHAPTR
ncbi:transposase family protein (plasmid) [Streptomyces sp. CA-294286]|uniref:transposase family protein n=1 Tax=Streptomyces sp. CA-294286 TaxID=3240070 RepID=UPI003D8E653F